MLQQCDKSPFLPILPIIFISKYTSYTQTGTVCIDNKQKKKDRTISDEIVLMTTNIPQKNPHSRINYFVWANVTSF